MRSIVNKKIILSGKYYDYEFERKRIRNINLRIRTDGTIYVSAPLSISDKKVEEFILSKEDFIINAINKVNLKNENSLRPDSIGSGTEVRIFGRKRVVTLISSDRNEVLLTDDNIFICIKDINNSKLINRVYNKWRSDCLKQKILHIASEVQPQFIAMGARVPSGFKFRTMKSRWGSCKPGDGTLTFNYNLVEVPEDCIRYVVIHEYAHLLVPNHSDRFYRYVARVMPDWKEKRRILNEF